MSNDEPTTLQEVAQCAALRHGGASGRALSTLAERDGFTLTHTALNEMLGGTYAKRPTSKTLAALAHLSGLDLATVREIAKKPVLRRPLADELPEDADSLDEEQRQHVLTSIRLFAQQNRRLAELEAASQGGGAHADSAAPNTTPQPDGAQESGKVVRPKFGSGPGAIEYDDKVPGPGESTAARDTGQLSEGHKEREAADKRGEESQGDDS